MSTPPLRKLAGYSAAVLVLVAVFSLYLQPEFLVDIANQVWACF